MLTIRRGSWRALVAAACLVTVLGGATWVLTDRGANREEEEYPIQAALPRDFLVHLSINGVACHEGCGELALAQLMDEPQMKQFAAPIHEMLEGLIDREVAPMLEEFGLTVDDVHSLAGGGLTLTVVDFEMDQDSDKPDIDVVVTLDAGKNPELVGKIAKVVARMVEEEANVKPEAVEIGGLSATRADLDGVEVFWTGIGRHLLFGTKSRTLGAVATRLKSASRAGGMLEGERAVNAWNKTVPSGDAVVWSYVDVDGCMKVVDSMGLPPEVGLVLSMVGLDSISDLAYGLSFEGRAVVDRLWVGAPRKLEGLYAGVVRSDEPLATMAMAPRDCWAYEALRYDLKTAIKELRIGIAELDEDVAAEIDEMLVQAEKELGFSILGDLLPSLGSELGWWVAEAPFGGLVPELIVAVELRDAEKFHSCLGKARAAHGELVRSFEFMGRDIGYLDLGRVINEPGGWGFGPKPAWMVQDGFVMIALAPQTLKNYIAAGNRQRPTIASHPDFAEAAKHFGQNGKGTVGVAFFDTGELLAAAVDTVLPIAQSVQFPAEFPVDMTQLPTTDVFRRHLFGITVMCSSVEGGFVTEIYSPTGYVTTVAALGAVLGGIGAVNAMKTETDAAAVEWEDWEETEPEPVEEDGEPDENVEEGGGR